MIGSFFIMPCLTWLVGGHQSPSLWFVTVPVFHGAGDKSEAPARMSLPDGSNIQQLHQIVASELMVRGHAVKHRPERADFERILAGNRDMMFAGQSMWSAAGANRIGGFGRSPTCPGERGSAISTRTLSGVADITLTSSPAQLKCVCPGQVMTHKYPPAPIAQRQRGGPPWPAPLRLRITAIGYLTNSISRYVGSGQRSSATTPSSLSAALRSSAIAGRTLSRKCRAWSIGSPWA